MHLKGGFAGEHPTANDALIRVGWGQCVLSRQLADFLRLIRAIYFHHLFPILVIVQQLGLDGRGQQLMVMMMMGIWARTS
jgi:hypothetical protein